MTKIRMVLVDDDTLVLNLIQSLFETSDVFEVLFICTSGMELLERIEEVTELPDILLLDLKMEGLSGIDITERVRSAYPSIKIVILSSHYKSSHIGFMFKIGASAFLPKGVSPIQLIEVVKNVHEKGYFFNEDQMTSMRGQIISKQDTFPLGSEELLSEREKEIIRLICAQKTAKEIAETLFITQRTVEGHKNNMFVKTGAKNIAGLVIYAIQNKLVDEDSLPIF